MRHQLGIWLYGWGRIIMFAGVVLILGLFATWYRISPLIKNGDLIAPVKSLEKLNEKNLLREISPDGKVKIIQKSKKENL